MTVQFGVVPLITIFAFGSRDVLLELNAKYVESHAMLLLDVIVKFTMAGVSSVVVTFETLNLPFEPLAFILQDVPDEPEAVINMTKIAI